MSRSRAEVEMEQGGASYSSSSDSSIGDRVVDDPVEMEQGGANYSSSGEISQQTAAESICEGEMLACCTRASTLVFRLIACAMAVVALWLTSLSSTTNITGLVVPRAPLQDVQSTVWHSVEVANEQRDVYEECVTDQSAHCDANFEKLEDEAREATTKLLASTEATLKQATDWTASCDATREDVQASLETWLSQGVGHSVLYSRNCTDADDHLTAGLLGDMSSPREDIHASSEAFTFIASATVSKLSSYAVNLSAYSSAYMAKKARVVDVSADRIVRSVAFEVPAALNATLQRVGTLGDELVACTSLRGDEDGQCPGKNARALVDESRQQLDLQLSAAREGLKAYEAAFAQYVEDTERAYANMVEFYEGAMQLRARVAGYFVDDSPWTTMTLSDFHAPKPTLPSSNEVLSGFDHAMTAQEIWEEVSDAHFAFEEGVADVIADVNEEIVDLSREWKDEAAEAVANISFKIDFDDFDPPRFDAVGLSIEGDTDASVEYFEASFQESAAAFASANRKFLDSLEPPGFNTSFPVAPPLVDNFTVGKVSGVVASPFEGSFVDFPDVHVNVNGWILISVGKLGFLLLIADYMYRCFSSVRMLARFWGRASVGMPDADLRVGKKASRLAICSEGTSKIAARLILHPHTKMVPFTFIGVLVVAVLISVYIPLLADYRAGCVKKTKEGSTLGEVLYPVAYNYAAEGGDRARSIYTNDYTSRQGTVCASLLAGLRQNMTEIRAELRAMYEKHHEDVTAVSLLGTCLDVDGMDSFYEEACCGREGYSRTCLVNSTHQCPVKYASGVAAAYEPVGRVVFDDACAKSTLEPEHWQVESDVTVNCDTIKPCEMTCPGPDKKVLRDAVLSAGCTVEWYILGGILRFVVILVVFLSMNASREAVMKGLIKFTWRHMHNGMFTFKGTSTRTGELLTNETSTGNDQMEEGTAGGDSRYKRVIAEAIEETLLKYEDGACGTLTWGVLLFLSSVLILLFFRGTVTYNAP